MLAPSSLRKPYIASAKLYAFSFSFSPITSFLLTHVSVAATTLTPLTYAWVT